MVSDTEIINCHACDNTHYVLDIPEHAKAMCQHCGALLYRHVPNSLDRSIALYITSFFLYIFANIFPFISLNLSGRVEENILISSGLVFYKLGMWELAVLVLVTSVIFPFIAIAGMLYMLIPVRLGFEPLGLPTVYRIVNSITPWSMVGVFMLGVLIAIVKLQDLATVVPGLSLYAFAALVFCFAAARASLQPELIWSLNQHQSPRLNQHEKKKKWLNCHNCGLLAESDKDYEICQRCHSSLHFRKENSIQRTWALIFAATVLIIPANTYPVMTVIRFGQGEPNTIFSGIVHLIESGMWGLGLIVFFASIVIPVLKLIILSYLLITVQYNSSKRIRDRTILYRMTEVVGAWSMVDIYLVGLLSALVSMDSLATIRPGIGATFFAGVVIITMFAAHSFDPRLIWDRADNNE